MADQHPRGLVTVSLLKSYFDERHDHLEMFMPCCWTPSEHLGRMTFRATK